MEEKEIFSTKYNKISIKPQSKKSYKNPEQKHLKKYKTIKEIKFSTTSVDISICNGTSSQNLLSIFGQNEINIYDTQTNTEISKFKFLSQITSGIFRNDGKVILVGDETGKIFIHEIITKNLIRKYNAHTLGINSIDIDTSLVKFVSASKDCSFKYFDMINEKPIKEYKKSHLDSVTVSKFFTNDNILTGSHDKTIKLWDMRTGLKTPEIIFDNSNKICDDIIQLNENYFFATADNTVILYDIRKDNENLNYVNPVKNTITKLILAKDNTRLFLLTPGENFITTLDISDLSMRSLYNIYLKEKIFAFDIQKNLEFFVVGFEGGNNVIRTKPIGTLSNLEKEDLEKKNLIKMEEDEDEQLKLLDPSKYSVKPIVKNYKYFFRGQYKKNLDESDLYINKETKIKLSEIDKHLKKFQYQKALNTAVNNDNQMIFSVIDELVDRNTLKLALLNEDKKALENLLKFVKNKIHNNSNMNQILYLLDLIYQYYGVFKEKDKDIKKLFDDIENEINDEINFEKKLIQTNSEIEAIVQTYQFLNDTK